MAKLPPGYVGLVDLVAQEVLLQLVEVEADEPSVGDGAAEPRVLNGLLEARLVGFKEGLAPFLREEDAFAFVATAEVLRLQGAAVYQGEDNAVHDNGLEDLGHVQVQGVAAAIGGVEEAYAWVEVGTVDLA